MEVGASEVIEGGGSGWGVPSSLDVDEQLAPERMVMSRERVLSGIPGAVVAEAAEPEPPAALEFDHLVLLAPHEVGEYGGYKRRANEVVLDRGKRHLLVYPVESLGDGSVHGLLSGNVSIRGLNPALDRLLLLEMGGVSLQSVQEMMDEGANGEAGLRWAASGQSDNLVYLSESPDGQTRFIYFHLGIGVPSSQGYEVENWPGYVTTDASLLGVVSAEEAERMEVWASELIGGDGSGWGVPPSLDVDEQLAPERAVMSRD